MTDPGLHLLLQFQRLLLVRIYSEKGENAAALGLLCKYLTWLCQHAMENIDVCIPLIQQHHNNIAVLAGLVTAIRNNNIIGTTAL